MSKKYKILISLVIIVVLIALGGVTYAYYLWSSPSSDVSLETENLTVTVDGGADISGVSLVPVDDKSKGIIKNFTVTNENEISIYVNIDILVNDIDEELKDESFVYKLYEVSNEEENILNGGNLISASIGDTIYVSNDILLSASETKTFRLYLYLDGTIESPSDMQGKSFDFTIETSASTRKTGISNFIKNRAISNTTLNNLALGSYYENGDFLVINRAPLGADYQVNVKQYEYRYVGKTPSNYVWFNCSSVDSNGHTYGDSDYEYNTTNCEKWRIIGVFLTEVPVYDDDGNITSYKWQYLTKIIRNDSIGGFSWDNKGSYGSNDWYTSRLMKTLNYGYDNNDEDGDGTYESNSLYYNRLSGTCFSGSSSAEKSCNFTTSGLRTESKDYIETVKWYLGGQNSNSYTEYFYKRERSYNKYSTNTGVNWTGKIALMYPSDYGYAAGSVCAMNTSRVSYNNSNSDYRGCASTNWMYNNGNEWMLSPSSSYSNDVSHVFTGGSFYYGNLAYNAIGVRPVLYLKSSTSIKDGVGTDSEPYVITMS